jgi:hypothetical protein
MARELGIPDTVDEALAVLRIPRDAWEADLAERPARVAEFAAREAHRIGIDGPVGPFYAWQVLARIARESI